MVISDSATCISDLHALRALGVSIGLDDLGTGCSSLSYLKHLPVDHLLARPLPSAEMTALLNAPPAVPAPRSAPEEPARR